MCIAVTRDITQEEMSVIRDFEDTDTGALQAQPGTVEDLVNFINLQQSLGVLPIVNQLEVPVVSQGVMV